MLVAIYRRYEGNRQFFDQEVEEEDLDNDERHGTGPATATATGVDGQMRQGGAGLVVDGMGGGGGGQRLERRKTVMVVKKKFRTSTNSVALLTGLSFAAYVTLMVLLWELSR